jgi:hypothetical protein
VPIYELGKLADGRWYYTMREVRGRSLGVVIREVHGDARDAGHWVPTSSGWTFRAWSTRSCACAKPSRTRTAAAWCIAI